MNVGEVRVLIPHGPLALPGRLALPPNALGLVIFAHGSGSSRNSPRNQAVARALQDKNIGTLLFDLLTAAEAQAEFHTGRLRFNIPLLADRLSAATRWAAEQKSARNLPLGYFGASTGAAAALVAAAEPGNKIRAVVSRGGRPDLAGEALGNVAAPTLLIVGGCDETVLELNRRAREQLNCPSALTIVPGAAHLFEEPNALETVAWRAAEWFVKHFALAR